MKNQNRQKIELEKEKNKKEGIMKKILLAAIIFAANNFILSQGAADALRYSEPGLYASARSLAMGNAFVSISDDYSGFMFNPAGLGLLKRIEFGVGLLYDYSKTKSTLYNSSMSSGTGAFNLASASYAFAFPTIRGSLTLGAALTQEKNFNFSQEYEAFNSGAHSLIQDLVFYGSRDDKDLIYGVGLSYTSNGRDTTLISGKLLQYGSIARSGGIYKLSFAGSIEIDKNLFFGLSIGLPYGKFDSDFEFVELDKNNVYQNRLDPSDASTLDFYRFDLIRLLKQDVNGVNFSLGLLYQVENYFRFGLSLKTPTFYTIVEKYSMKARSEFAAKNFESSIDYEKIKYDINTPFQFAVGASYNFGDAIISIDGNVIDYSTMEFSAGLGSFNRREINKIIKERFRTSFIGNFGVEYKLKEKLNLRGGFIYQQSPYNNDPSDYDKKYATFGFGTILGQTLALDIAAAIGFWKDYNDNYGYGESRVFQELNKTTIVLSSSYRF
jgi:long-subunit fatty acid transport protein